MEETLVRLFAEKFISRPDVKAIQRDNGDFNPLVSPFTRQNLLDHLRGDKSYGHYLTNKQDECKLFAFDIDLEKAPDVERGEDPETVQLPTDYSDWSNFAPADPRKEWRNRASPVRPYLKYILRVTATRLAATVKEEMDVPVAIAYSGSKGLHVYGFTGKGTLAKEAREAAKLALRLTGGIEPHKGNNFFKPVDREFSCVSVEIYPKQDTMAGKEYGNLLRLPLGRNLKSADPTFFVDSHAPLNQLLPAADPVSLLQNGDPWA